MFKTVEKSQKDFKELNYSLLGATLLCDLYFIVTIQYSKEQKVLFIVEMYQFK